MDGFDAIGMDILGWDNCSFHSFLCNSLQDELNEPKALEQNPRFWGKELDLELAPSCMIESSADDYNDWRCSSMTIKEVCEKYDITADTLRYYERVGVIPTVTRTAGGIRDYQESDIGWVENAICFRDAGMPVEMLIEYVRLFQEGDSTIDARAALLKEARETIIEAKKKYDIALEKLDYKIGRYEIAQKTGELTWD